MRNLMIIGMLIVLLVNCQTPLAAAASKYKIPAAFNKVSGSKAAENTSVREHPVIKAIPGSVLKLSESKNLNYHTYKFEVGPGKYEEVSGPYWELHYYFPGPDGKPDKNIFYVEVQENFKRAVLANNGDVIYKTMYRMTFTLVDNGKKYWVYVHSATRGRYSLHIIEQKDFNPTLVFDANAMKNELYNTGRIAIHDINFDYDQAVILPGSEVTLLEIVKMLKEDPAMRIEIQGHTDDQGDRLYNVELSQRRADAVRLYLVSAGINPSRLETRGLGPDFPLESNDTEEGRRENRRVELKKIL